MGSVPLWQEKPLELCPAPSGMQELGNGLDVDKENVAVIENLATAAVLPGRSEVGTSSQ